MSWVKAILTANINGGHIDAKLSNLKLIEGPRPKGGSEFGSSAAALLALNARMPGSYIVPVRVAAGAAIVISDIRNLFWGKWGTELSQIEKKFGPFGPHGLICQFRDAVAPHTWLCADLAFGALSKVEDFRLTALREATEVGIYRGQVWARFVLPDSMSSFQKTMLEAQQKSWAKVAKLSPAYDLSLRMNTNTPDLLNGFPVILATEPQNGSLEIAIPFLLDLQKKDWRLKHCDLCIMPDGSNIPLDRKQRIICPRPGRPPIMICLGPNGLEIDHEVIPLEGEVLEKCVNEKVQAALSVFGWTKQ